MIRGVDGTLVINDGLYTGAIVDLKIDGVAAEKWLDELQRAVVEHGAITWDGPLDTADLIRLIALAREGLRALGGKP